MSSETSAARQCSSSQAQAQGGRPGRRYYNTGRYPVVQQADAIADEHARIDELRREAYDAEQELFAQLQEAPDSPEVALLQQKVASIRADAAALQQRVEEMRLQTPEEHRDLLDRMVERADELRRFGPHGSFGRWAPRSQGRLPSWLECLLPSWMAARSSPSSSVDAEVPAGVGVELRGPDSATASAAAGQAATAHLHARHRHVQQHAPS